MSGVAIGQRDNGVHVGGNVYGGGNEAKVGGNSSVTINQQDAVVSQDVYGGGALADVNTLDGTSQTPNTTTTVTLTKGTVRNVYGGGLGRLADAQNNITAVQAKVFGPVQVNINGGTVTQSVYGCNNLNGAPQSTVKVYVNDGSITENVYGGGNLAAYTGSPEVYIYNGSAANVFGGGNGDPDDDDAVTAMVTGNPVVLIGDATEDHKAIISSNVYGGGNAAKVTGNTSVTYNDNNANSSVAKLFGGGNAAGVTGTATVNMALGKVTAGVYGGCNTKGAVGGNITVNLTGGSVGVNNSTTDVVFGGGYGQPTTTGGNVTLTANGTTVYGSVYGGSALGSVNASASNNTTVNITSGTISGSVYGGGLGSDEIAALVNGKVYVKIGLQTQQGDNAVGPTVQGEIYGCNNLNGSPQDDVFVDIYHTQHNNTNQYPTGNNAITTLEQLAAATSNYDQPAYANNFALSAVYGGGNKAAYTPAGKTTQVTIWGCQENTIQTVYGGGNAADATNVSVIIKGGRFDRVFGGGNGYSQTGNHGNPGQPYYNPGADITESAATVIEGGLYRQVFGGSNQYGDVASASLTFDKDPDCVLLLNEAFGGANEADIQGDVTTTLACSDLQIGTFYGGSNLADIINGNVTLNVYGGTYNDVFGGSKGSGNKAASIQGNVDLNLYGGEMNNAFGGCDVNGNITGKISVNVLDMEKTNCGLAVHNIYGGGRDATYTPTSSEATGSNNSPVVNLIHGEVSKKTGGNGKDGNVFGGAYGADATVTASPKVNIGYNSATMSGSVPSTLPTGYTLPTTYAVTVAGNVYGGGDLAKVLGNTSVNIQKASMENAATTVTNNVYGGGNQANVSGSSVVSVTGGNVTGDVYGGGALAHVNINESGNTPTATANASTSVSITGGSARMVFGGGMGQSSPSAIAALVYGNTQVSVTGGAITGGTIGTGVKGAVFGGCNERGSVLGTATVNINTAIGGSENKCNIYGGGLGQHTNVVGDVAVTLNANSNTIYGDIYGGSAKGLVNYSNAATPAPNANTTTVVTLTSGTVSGNIYGGGHGLDNAEANVGGPVTVNINGGAVNNVFGCNNVKGAPKNTVKVNINNNVAQNVYGGGNLAAYTYNTGNYPEVNLLAGTVGVNVFGGGLGASATVTGNPVVNLQGGAVTGKVFGGGSAAPVSGHPKVNALYGSAPTIHGGGLGNTAVVTGNPTVIVNQTSGETLTVNTVYGGGDQAETVGATSVQLTNGTITSAFGGGNVADVTGTTTVTLEGATVNNIYGGGNEAGVSSTTTVTITSGNVNNGVYGGCNSSGTVGGAINVYVNGGQVGTNATSTANVHGGGYGSSTATGDAVTVTVGNGTSTPVIWGDVYGGSALGNVNDAVTELTKVWLKSGTVNGCLYGGGLGDGSHPAQVNGKVQVIVDGGSVLTTTNTGKTTGAVFGCNNVNGTPKGTVEVTINSTAPSSGSGSTKVYALQGVYGGGNLAHYNPTTTNNEYPKVTVNGCASSIKDVFGGGNSAAVPNTNVIINAGDIKRVFAGGNGESGTPAHVGYMNTLANPTGAGYGTGKANATIKAGTIVQVFGGSNKTGVIRDNGALSIAKDGTTCNMIIGEVYGGGNEANGAAGSISIGCTGTLTPAHSSTPGNIGTTLEGIGAVYGGANAADVSSNIQLTIEDGLIQNVFGGNNASGTISGSIVVNINQKAIPCGWYVGNVYGGGNLADHTGASTVNIINGQVSNNVFGGGNEAGVGSASIAVSGGGISKGLYGGCNTSGIVAGDATISITGGTIGASGAGNTANVYGGGLGENTKVRGNVTVTINNGTGTIYGDVYGGSAKGLVNCTDAGTAQYSSSKTDVTLTNGTITGNIYGGGHGLNDKNAHVWGPVTVTVNNGSVTNVFGGNNLNGAPQKAVKVEIKGGTVTNNIYGGGDQAAYNGTPEVIVDGGSVAHKVIGGGNMAGVGGGNVKIKSGSVGTDQTADNGVYGGCNQSGEVSGAIAVEVTGGTIGTQAALNNLMVTNVFGGGYGSSTSTTGNVTVTISKATGNNAPAAPTIYGDVYGGSALGSVNQNGSNSTTVNIMGGTLETKITHETAQQFNVYNGGNVYGGGLGNADHAAAVNGTVTVNIGTGTLGAPDPDLAEVTNLSGSAVIKGNVYGCNNTKGSPQQNVTVNVFQTDRPTDYVLPNVFGGGNKADFTVSGKTAKVNVYTCDNVIGRVFGGGNAAATNSVRTMIQGGTIAEVYGGGNGEVSPANVNGTATLIIHGGSIGMNFGGSNQQGTISQGATVTVDDAVCTTDIDEFFCGGNLADFPGNINATIECNNSLNVRNLYGGCNKANVVPKGTPGDPDYEPGNIHLKVKGGVFENVYGGSKGDLASLGEGHTDKSADIAGDVTLDLLGGTIDTVFGGCNINGNIAGKIIVNVIDTVSTDCPLVIHNVYGGGRDASYTPTDPALVSPEVNIIHGSITKSTTTSTDGNVFGGGFGATAAINASPKVRVGYDASMSGYLPTGYAITENNRHAVVEGNVYGGGDLAPVNQSTVVTIQKTNSSVEGNMFGGGNLANVLHSTTVNVNGGVVTEDVYGGGALADVGTNSSDNTVVTVAGGTVSGSVYGGGLGDATHQAEVKGAVQVTVNGGTINDVFGCNNVKGAPTSTVRVDINSNVGGNVYGGGNQAACSVSPAVCINKGTVTGNVFGGGLGSTAVVTGTPTVTVGNLTNGDVVATVSGDVYGGGDAANVVGTTAVLVQKCNTVINGDVYGGGNAAHVNKNGSTGGTTSVTVTGGTINNSSHTNAVFGGGHGDKDQGVSANVATSTSVIINGGTINQVFGGSNSAGTINGGNAGGISVLVNKTDNSANSCQLHITELYGGGNYAASQAGSIDIRCTGTVANANEGIDYVYGGANRADVTGPINLTIQEGRIGNVFGGNNNSGTITGAINVSIEKKASPCVWEIGNVYGGGNLAEYAGTPKVYIKNGTVANVFGGGNGDPSSTTQIPGQVGGSDVTIGDATAGYSAVVTGNVYGGGNAAKVSGNAKVTYNDTNASSQVGNLFGGGNSAGVTGKTEVFLTHGKVTTNVYGGCNTKGTVGTTSTVTLTGGTVQGSVFGGGFGSNTEVTGKATVDISGSSTSVVQDVYGGGDNGQVKGGTEVNIH